MTAGEPAPDRRPGGPLSGRVALVTGVSRRIGIGFGVARRPAAGARPTTSPGWWPGSAPTDAAWITGQVINSEGGFRRYG